MSLQPQIKPGVRHNACVVVGVAAGPVVGVAVGPAVKEVVVLSLHPKMRPGVRHVVVVAGTLVGVVNVAVVVVVVLVSSRQPPNHPSRLVRMAQAKKENHYCSECM